MPKFQFTVTVQSEHLPERSEPGAPLHAFAYTITIANTGEGTAQLIARHWIIRDATGHTEEVKGLGVVGQQPLLRPGESFRYTSGCQLRTASGTMQGSYFFVGDEGTRFDVAIPLFALDAAAPPGADAAAPRVLH